MTDFFVSKKFIFPKFAVGFITARKRSLPGPGGGGMPGPGVVHDPRRGAWSRGVWSGGGSCPGGVGSRGDCLVLGGMPGGDPPDGYCCGRYASYWNAFLLKYIIGFFSVPCCPSIQRAWNHRRAQHQKVSNEASQEEESFRICVRETLSFFLQYYFCGPLIHPFRTSCQGCPAPFKARA